MEFMDMLKEWLRLRDRENAEDDKRPIETKYREHDRMAELEYEINRRARGEPCSGRSSNASAVRIGYGAE